MDKLNIENIKKMTGQMIAYDKFEEREKMKNKKIRTFSLVIMTFVLLIGGTLSVNALTDNSIGKAIKKSALKIFFDDKEVESECTKNDDGTLSCTIIKDNSEIKYTVYDEETAKDLRIDIDTKENNE